MFPLQCVTTEQLHTDASPSC